MFKNFFGQNKYLKNPASNFNTWGLVVVLIMLLLAVGGWLTYRWQLAGSGDIPVYQFYSQRIFSGDVPYRDLSLEYPPGVLPFILLAKPIGRLLGQYSAGFLILTFFAMAIFLRLILGRMHLKYVLFFCLLVAPLIPFFFGDLDIFAALALFGAIYLYLQKRYSYSALLLAASVVIKFYSIVCLPVFLMSLPRRCYKKYLVYFSLAVTAIITPFIIISPSGFWHSITFQAGRPTQIESGPAAVGIVMKLFGAHIKSYASHKSYALQFPDAHLVGAISTLCLFGALAIYYVWLYRLRIKQNLALCCLPPILIYIIFFKAGSPQYMVTLFFVAAAAVISLSGTEKIRLYARLMIISSVIYFTFNYYEQLLKLNGFVSALVVLRYLLLAELLIWILNLIKFKSTNTLGKVARAKITLFARR